ncbi:MAG TPA: potassium transporter KefB [Candidatus Marinimicrobia bacterium]|nr:potassium transporter KefB [Candidatus Neomarinimicrobiota bacterium]
MEYALLKDIVYIFGLSIIILIIFHRIQVPFIVGYLLTGILVGPYGLALIEGVSEVEVLAEIGIVLLLFTIGVEFSFKNLLQIKRSVLIGGPLQVIFTTVVGFTIALSLDMPIGESIFIGFLLSLSSTVIVLKLLQERAEVDTPQGQTALGILIFQDILIVPMMLLTPLLAENPSLLMESPYTIVAKGIGIVIFAIILAKWIVPRILYYVVRTQSRELFILSIITICFSVAWISHSVGLSLALGAFLAGLVVSESGYSHHTLDNVLPLRDVFTSFFFISIGMLLDIKYFFEQPTLIILLVLGILIIKTIATGFASLLIGFPLRIAILVGLALSQVGEFSFILAKTGLMYGFLSGDYFQLFLSISVLSMVASPFVITFSPHLAGYLMKLPLPQRFKFVTNPVKKRKKFHSINDHLVIIGYGFNGRNLAQAAKMSGIPYSIIEMNPEIVREADEKNEPIYYGDAVHESILKSLNIEGARIAVVAISDPATTRRIISTVRKISPNIHIIVRSRYIRELNQLFELGANEVIPEEFETSVEIFTRVLTKYLIPRDEIEAFISEVRSHCYEILRSPLNISATYSDLDRHVHGINISTFRIHQNSPINGKTLVQIDLRKQYGVSVVAIQRDSKILPNPDADMVIQANDVLYVIGSSENIIIATHKFASLNESDENP